MRWPYPTEVAIRLAKNKASTTCWRQNRKSKNVNNQTKSTRESSTQSGGADRHVFVAVVALKSALSRVDEKEGAPKAEHCNVNEQELETKVQKGQRGRAH